MELSGTLGVGWGWITGKLNTWVTPAGGERECPLLMWDGTKWSSRDAQLPGSEP